MVDAALAGGVDEGVDRQRGVLGLERDELLGELWGQAPRLAPVGATLRVQSVEAAGAVQRQPIAQGLGGDAGAPGAGNHVGVPGLVAQAFADAWGAGGEMDDIGEEPVAEQCHGLAQCIIGVIQWRGPRRSGGIAPGDGHATHTVAAGQAPCCVGGAGLRFVVSRRCGTCQRH